MNTNQKPLSFFQKISYGGGNFAANLMVTFASTYITYFYTNIAGISVATAGIILLVGRLFDGISDLIMGSLVDHTHSRYGKARCWLLWMAVPFGISIALMFISPNWGQRGKAIYAALSYIIAEGIIYTALCVPYNTLSSLSTEDMNERTQLSAFRTFLGYAGALMVSTLSLNFVEMLGGGATGWRNLAMVYGLIGALLYLNVFIQLKENVSDSDDTANIENASVLPALKSLVINKYWLFTLFATLASFLFSGLTGGMVYYAQYIIGNANFISAMSMAHFIPVIICAIFLAPLASRLGKRNMALTGIIIMLIGQLIAFLFPVNTSAIIIAYAIRGTGMAAFMVPIFAMVGDAAEYSYLKTGIRSEGLAFSAVGFAEKVGTGLGGVILTTILSIGGFDASLTTQPETAFTAIRICMNIVPFFTFLLSGIFVFLYQLDKILPDLKNKNNF